jgi:hypothetical protein
MAKDAGKDDAVIVVNGEPKDVADRDVSYEGVVELAFPGLASDPNNTFTVLYRKADHSRTEGSLVAGGSVKVHKQGTSFSVTRSIRS